MGKRTFSVSRKKKEKKKKKDIAPYNTVYKTINLTLKTEIVSSSLKELPETYLVRTIRYCNN